MTEKKRYEPLTDQQKQYIIENYERLTISKMSMNRRLSGRMIREFLKEQGLLKERKVGVAKVKEIKEDMFSWENEVFKDDLIFAKMNW